MASEGQAIAAAGSNHRNFSARDTPIGRSPWGRSRQTEKRPGGSVLRSPEGWGVVPLAKINSINPTHETKISLWVESIGPQVLARDLETLPTDKRIFREVDGARGGIVVVFEGGVFERHANIACHAYAT